jgi:hypothetical protein
MLLCALVGVCLLPAQQSAADAFAAATSGNQPKAPAVQQTSSTASGSVAGNTALVVKIIDDIDSERDPVGRVFPAMVDDPLVVNGQTVLPRGTDAKVKLVQGSGKDLALELVEIYVDGRSVPLQSKSVELTKTPRAAPPPEPAAAEAPKQSGKAATLGILLGALSGTQQGEAYIGTVTGSASAGVAKTWLTGPRVRLNEETRLTFTIAGPVKF